MDAVQENAVNIHVFRAKLSINAFFLKQARPNEIPWSERGEVKMPECPLLTKCPYASDISHDFSEMNEEDKEQYCKGDYGWCGRYMTYKARQKEPHRQIFFEPGGKDDLK